ncbi:MAG: hypothetical protein JET69_03830 [Methanomassiliicoccales archaeon]|nr:hypothetical protein [Methanomassiliicoccales archaeon]
MKIEALVAFREDYGRERPIDQVFTFFREQHARFQVGLPDHKALVKRDIAHWSQIVQLKIFSLGYFQLGLGPTKLFVLDLQLFLMNEKFLDKPGFI